MTAPQIPGPDLVGMRAGLDAYGRAAGQVPGARDGADAMNELSDREFEILHHAIGSPKHAALCREPWRNRYVAGAGHHSFETCRELCVRGLMVEHESVGVLGGMSCFVVTEAGIAEVSRRLPVLRAWAVTMEIDGETGTDTVYARSRSAARADRIYSIMDAWNCTWREALGVIRSVRLA